jgi:hypothetical protein
MSTLKVSTISPLGTDATKTITIGSASNGDVAAGVFTNVPAFYADLSSDQSTSDAITTKAQINNVLIDTNNCYDNTTNYRFTPTVAGKYLVYGNLRSNSNTNSATEYFLTHIYKNGSEVSQKAADFRNNYGGLVNSVYSSIVLDMNGTSDYVELFGTHAVTSGAIGFDGSSSHARSYFGAYRLIGA